MYLTRVELNLNKRETQFAFTTPNKFHGAIETAFKTRQNRNLWRIDRYNGKYYLLLLSEEIPDMEKFISQFGDCKILPETKEYDRLLDRITKDSLWHFRLVANPTYSKKTKEGRGKVTAHITPEHQMEWLKCKSEKYGFELIEDSYMVTSKEWKVFSKKEQNKKVRVLFVAFEGTLIVKDADKFKKALTEGIGRGKAYGAGLLTVNKI